MTFDGLHQDLRLALRGLWRARGFSLAAVATLALGMAGTTMMFALIQGVLLKPLRVDDQDHVLVAWKKLRAVGLDHYPFGGDEVDEVARGSQTLDNVAGVTSNGAGRWIVVDAGVAKYATGVLVTGGFFDVLGTAPLLGRTLARSDDRAGAEPVVVISSGLWQRWYGGAVDAIGRRISIADQSYVIVGVVPEPDFPQGVEMWRTIASLPTDGPLGYAPRRETDLIARLRPGYSIAQATSELTALTERIEVTGALNRPRGLRPVVRPLEDVVVGDVRLAMLILFGAVGLVLLIASANVANLLLLRGEARRSELAVRTALGAGRGRIARQLLAESLVLTVAAAALALALTAWGLQSLLLLVPDGLPRVESIGVEPGVVLFSLIVTFATTLMAGLAPAMISTRLDVVSHLRSGGRSVTGASARHTRRALVVAQVALAITVIASAGLLTRTLLHLQTVDLGFAEHLVFVELAVPQSKAADPVRHGQFLDRIIEDLQAMPAIAAATPVNVPPFTGTSGWELPQFTAEGQSAEQAASNPSLNFEAVHPTYFDTFQVSLLRGRAFTGADRDSATNVAIVTDDVAARLWPGEDPLGKRLKMGTPTSERPWRTVVGIVRPTRYRALETARPTLYLPAAQSYMTAQLLVLRTTAPLDLITALARERVRAVDAEIQIMRVAPFAAMLEAPLARPRFNAWLLNIFGVAALLLAAVGLYAVMAAYVRQRDREIGVRVALGATASNVRALVLGEALRLAGLGAIIGLAGAIGAAHLVHGLLYDVHPLDPWTLAGAVMLLVAAAALAASLPVRRATRLDAAILLKE